MSNQLFVRWEDYIRQRNTPKTVQLYLNILNRHIHSLPNFPPKSREIEEYLTHFCKTHKARTANHHLTAIKSFYRWCESQGVANPAKSVHFLPEEPPKVRCLSEAEYEMALRCAKGLLKKSIQFLGNTGLRESEFCSLTWNHFSPDYQFIHVDGKGRKRRSVPLNNICRQLLVPRCGPRPDFINQYGHPRLLYYYCTQLAQRLRIEPFGSHALRHYFATRLIRNKVPLAIVSRILGHSSTVITEKTYLHLCPADLQVTDCLRF